VGSLDVGVIRFDALPNGRTEVSLYLDPRLYALGLGRALLTAGEEHIRHQEPRGVHFVAAVLEGNRASARLCGYRFERDMWHKEAAGCRPAR
jgi:RimJ/RimL family protein N-acetyltransferase